MVQIVSKDAYPFDDRELPIAYEQALTDKFVSYFEKNRGNVFLDVGAHLGTWTLRLARYFNRVIAFEPNPLAYEALKENVRLNGLSNVTCINMAVSNKNGKAKLVLYDCPGHSALEGGPIERTAPTGEVIVETGTIDSFTIGKVDLIKVDTEAHEVEVLEGAMNTLRLDKPRYCLENHSPALREQCIKILEACNLLDRFEVWPAEHRNHPVFGGYSIRL